MNELTESAIEKFRDAFARGIAGIVEAGEIYVKAIDADASAADTFRERFSDCLPASAWTGFEAVGRKWMHPKLMLGGMADRKTAARVKLLPYSMQTRVFNKERFDLLLLDGQVLKVSPLDCTPEQSEQLFDGPVIRDVSAQRAYLETTTRKAKAMPEAEPLPYVISGGRITFRKTTSMSKSEMKRIIQGM
jgi:hypothetical protein